MFLKSQLVFWGAYFFLPHLFNALKIHFSRIRCIGIALIAGMLTAVLGSANPEPVWTFNAWISGLWIAGGYFFFCVGVYQVFGTLDLSLTIKMVTEIGKSTSKGTLTLEQLARRLEGESFFEKKVNASVQNGWLVEEGAQDFSYSAKSEGSLSREGTLICDVFYGSNQFEVL